MERSTGASAQRVSATPPASPPLLAVTAWPRNSSIALVLRGEAFRDRKVAQGFTPIHIVHGKRSNDRPGTCANSTAPRQLAQGQSLLRHVIVPLEERQNRVDLFVSEGSGSCRLVRSLLEIWGSGRVVETDIVRRSHSQYEGLRRALDLVQPVRHAYALVLVARFDLTWKRSITTTEADVSKFNFLSRCELSAPDRGAHPCVHDAFFMFPGAGDGRFFSAISEALGGRSCFNPNSPVLFIRPGLEGGHWCSQPLREALGNESLGFLTSWRPQKRVTELDHPVAVIE